MLLLQWSWRSRRGKYLEFYTVAWTYSYQEIHCYLDSVIKQKWIIAGISITRGKWQYDDFCNIENHYQHIWYLICQKCFDCLNPQDYNCKYRIGVRQIHLGMDSAVLHNQMWWNEPQKVIEFDQEFFT